MIETTQDVTVAAPIGAVWNHVSDIGGWAPLMPGMQGVEIQDENRSRWVLKVGVGGLVRIVTVEVCVTRWAGPAEVDFDYTVTSDPVKGSGTFRASPTDDGETRIALHVKVEGSGPMAPMWEAMGRPVLPQLAKAFAGALKQQIESTAGPASTSARDRQSGIIARIVAWIVARLGLK
ncbi:MAG: CoxG family protein [Novosphingobium sp.]